MIATTGKLAGRAALVSGGASGIGEATARLFAAEGASVMITDIDDDRGTRVVEDICGAGGAAAYLHVDVTEREAVRQMVRNTAERFGRLDVLFNNAMTNPSADYSEDERWNLMLESGLSAYWAAATEAAPFLARSGHGAIVSNASIAGAKFGIDFASEAYSAAKAGVVGLTRKLAKRFGPDGIRANTICPGIIETPRWRSPGTPEPQFGKRWRQMVPLRRYGQTEEVARLVLFLASDDGSYVNAQDIAVDGGFTLAASFESIDFDAE